MGANVNAGTILSSISAVLDEPRPHWVSPSTWAHLQRARTGLLEDATAVRQGASTVTEAASTLGVSRDFLYRVVPSEARAPEWIAVAAIEPRHLRAARHHGAGHHAGAVAQAHGGVHVRAGVDARGTATGQGQQFFDGQVACRHGGVFWRLAVSALEPPP